MATSLKVIGTAAALLPLAIHAAAPRPTELKALPDTMAQRVAACTACHTAGADVKADASTSVRGELYFPRIAGKPAGYLYNQLRNFREGRRRYGLMTYMTEQLSDDYLKEVADYFASQHPPYPAPATTSATAAMLERGRVLALHGDPQKKIPACIACHGEKLAGVAPAIPGLTGLPRDYINAQFGAWRDKSRRAHAPDCMAEITARLSDADVAAVSGWLASQPADATIAPADSIARPLPLACGSSPDSGAAAAGAASGRAPAGPSAASAASTSTASAALPAPPTAAATAAAPARPAAAARPAATGGQP